MKRFCAILYFLILILSTGCSSTYRVSDYPSKEKFYEDFNKTIKNKNIIIKLTDETLMQAQGNTILIRDTLFTTSRINENERIPIVKIKDVIYNNKWVGTGMGFIFGTLGGLGLGILSTGTSSDDKDGPSLVGIIAAPLCIVAGIIIGWIHGYNYIYQFNP